MSMRARLCAFLGLCLALLALDRLAVAGTTVIGGGITEILINGTAQPPLVRRIDFGSGVTASRSGDLVSVSVSASGAVNWGGGTNSTARTADTYFTGDMGDGATSEANVDLYRAPQTCTLGQFRACVNVDPAGGSWAFTVRWGATQGALASSTVTCSIAAGDADLCCEDTSNTLAVTAGDYLTIFMDETGTLNSGLQAVTYRCI